MPEMPELETIKRSLEPHIKGRKITDVELLLSRQIKFPSPEEFVSRIKGQVISELLRRGKYLILKLNNGISLVIHLRMSGQACYCGPNDPDRRHSRIIFHLDDDARFIFADTRTLGTIYAMTDEELPQIGGLAELGPEPLSDEFTLEYLKNILSRKKGKIKSFLLKQNYIAGLGNIYVDECLFLAGINPLRTPDSVTGTEAKKLYASINKVIEDGINDGGTTFRDYRDGTGGKGSHQDNLYAYGRAGQPCRKCGTIMEKLKVGGRGTVYCPKCQLPK
ncbi:Formamidopyrimidine-DNA glycosylase [Anaerovibrio sp. JC8]|nr:Formamidopyrimidine-DNA glycosylase [Anaerovibrio sp. JC8]